MNTITGIGKIKISIALLSCLLIASCGNKNDEGNNASDSRIKTGVKVLPVSHHALNLWKSLPATVVYLNKSSISSPANAYIRSLNVKPGDRVQKGELLFSLETKEHRALKNDTSLSKEGIGKIGLIPVYAPSAGYIGNIAYHPGDFVQEATGICAFTSSENVYAKAFVPLSMKSFISKGQHCMIIRDDNDSLDATIEETLYMLDKGSQNMQVLVKVSQKTFLPENMQLRVLIPVMKKKETQLVPADVVLSNEKMNRFWVMQLLNDSTAVRVDIKTGENMGDSIEILQPLFDENTLLLSEGNYGLADTAAVKVMQ